MRRPRRFVAPVLTDCSPGADALARADRRARAAQQPADRTLLLEEHQDFDDAMRELRVFRS
ncbi:hypothetical protein [Kitasatospora sp. NPDC017646]|uniref:hypothetical protein n=1 Tax=Kitasatospora sp. NPDC017646 TaxID=3364024 RepID=UPI0037922D44